MQLDIQVTCMGNQLVKPVSITYDDERYKIFNEDLVKYVNREYLSLFLRDYLSRAFNKPIGHPVLKLNLLKDDKIERSFEQPTILAYWLPQAKIDEFINALSE